jgi:hypothetical protein
MILPTELGPVAFVTNGQFNLTRKWRVKWIYIEYKVTEVTNMKKGKEMFGHLLDWGRNNEEIRTIILTSSGLHLSGLT